MIIWSDEMANERLGSIPSSYQVPVGFFEEEKHNACGRNTHPSLYIVQLTPWGRPKPLLHSFVDQDTDDDRQTLPSDLPNVSTHEAISKSCSILS